MNYQRIYDRFIASRQGRSLSRPFDVHHIVPRCMGGADAPENMIALTPADHLFAHILLARIHGGFLTRAVFGMMSGKRYSGRRSRREYAWLRAGASAMASEVIRAANLRRGHSPRLGIKHTPEAIAKMRANRKGIPRSADAAERSAEKLRGRKQSKEHVEKRMASKKATLERIGHQASFGKSLPPELVARRVAIRAANKAARLNVSYSVSV